MPRAVAYVLAGVVVVVLAAIALVVTLLTLGEPRSLTNAIAETALSRAVGSPVRVAGSRGSPLFGLELSGVEIAPETRERFEIERLVIEVDPTTLLGDEISVRRVRVDGLRIDGRRSAQGRWAWAAGEIDVQPLPDSTDPATPATDRLRVRVRTFELEDARLRIAWARPGGEDGWLAARLDVGVRDFTWPMDERLDRLPVIEADLSEVSARAGAFSIDGGRASLRRDHGPIDATLSAFSGSFGAITHAEASFDVAGTTTAPALEAARSELAFQAIDPALFSMLADLDLPASALSGRANVDWDGARTTLRLELERSVLAGIDVQSTDASGQVWREDGALQFDLPQANVTGAFGRLEASVAGDLQGVRAGTLHAVELDLAALPEPLRPDWLTAGRLRGTGRWRGPWSAPRGELEAHLEDAVLAGIRIRSLNTRVDADSAGRLRVLSLDASLVDGPIAEFEARRPFVLAFGGDALTIHDALFSVAGGSIGIDGTLTSSAFESLAVELRAFDLAALRLERGDQATSGAGDDGEQATELGGLVDGTFEIAGRYDAPGIAGRVDWSAARFDGLEAGLVRLESTRLAGGRQSVRASIEEGGVFELEAEASFDPRGLPGDPARILRDESFEIDAKLRVSDIAAFAERAALASSDAPTAGWLTGTARVRGPLSFPRIEAMLEGRDLRWRDLPESDLEFEIDAADPGGRAKLRLAIGEAGRWPLVLDAETDDRARLADLAALATTPGTHGRIRVDGFDLAWLDAIGHRLAITARGRAQGDVAFESDAVPSVVGALHVDGLALDGAGLPFDIDPVDARFDFAGQVVRSTELRVTSKGGDAGVRGQISWQDPANPTLQVLVRAKDFHVDIPGVIVGRIDGDASVEGPVMALDAQGGFMLRNARIDLPDPKDPILREIQIRMPAAQSERLLEESTSEGVYDAMAGRISLTVGDSVWLRGLGAELELRGELTVKKEHHEPAALYGNVEVASGRVDFQGRWLRVTSGSAIFDGSTDPDPFVDAAAMHRVRDVTIHVRLRGRASDLQLELDSEPPMPIEDQLSYLVFDRPAAEISARDQQNISAAAMAASELLLGRFGNELAREVGLDRVRLGVDEADAPTVEVEKRLGDRVTVRYGRSFGVAGADRFVLEWQIFRELFVSGEQLTSGDSGLDVFWRHDY